MSVTIVQSGKAAKWAKRGLFVGLGVAAAGFVGGVISAQSVVRHVEGGSLGIMTDEQIEREDTGDTVGDREPSEKERIAASSAAFQKKVVAAIAQHAAAGEQRAKKAAQAEEGREAVKADQIADYVGRRWVGQPASLKTWLKDRAMDGGFYLAAAVMLIRDAGREHYREVIADLAQALEQSLGDDRNATSPAPGDVVGPDGVIMSGLYEEPRQNDPKPAA